MSSLPSLCSVCVASRAEQILPERSEGDWLFHPICVLCLDALLHVFPLRERKLRARELTGRWPREALRRKPPAPRPTR